MLPLIAFLICMTLLTVLFRFVLADPPLPLGSENIFAERWLHPRSSPVGMIRDFPSASNPSSPPKTPEKSAATRSSAGGDPTGADAGDQWASLVDYLSSKCPCIPANPSDIEILLTPATFFNCVTSMIARAEESIVVSALYIGDGAKSREFVRAIVAKIEEWSSRSTSAGCKRSIDLVLDYHRMRDKSNLQTVASIIGAAKGREEHCSVRLHLFQTPSALSSYLGILPSRAREVLGVQHTKVLVVDGRDLVLTGANLSDDYFTNRQDRYIVVNDNPLASRFYGDLVRTIAAMSHPLALDDGLPSERPRGSVLHRKSGLLILANSLGCDPMRETALFKRKASALVNEFIDGVVEVHRSPTLAPPVGPKDNHTTFLFPTLQFGRLGIHHDACVVRRVLLAANQNAQIYLTSPYLNVYSSFLDVILQSAASFDLVTASVETNGWRGQRGFAGLIPYFYLQLERSLFYLFKEYGVEGRVHIQEFKEPGTSYHAKGIWMSPCAEATASPAAAAADTMPYLAAYGSTNYGFRSVHKDVETEAFLFTTDPALRAKIDKELKHLLRMSARVDERRFTAGSDGRFQPVVALVAQLGQSFL